MIRKSDFTRSQMEHEKGVTGSAEFARYDDAVTTLQVQDDQTKVLEHAAATVKTAR